MKKKKSILAIQMGCRQLTYYSETADNKGIHTTLKIIWKNCTTHYSYDIHGNVDTLLQDNQQLSLISTALQPQRFKKIIYDFDLISGNVNLVSYQDGQPDAFYHFYEYDADNRIIAVYSSNYPQKNALINLNTVSNSPLWDNDAKYFYYAHGPLARVEYGDNKVQGEDYVYTLQGWIKGVNSNTLDTLRDIGKDGAIGSINSIFAKDAFGYTLNYHTNDYKAIDGLKWNTATNRFESIIAGSDLNNSRNDLFNGNITSMVTTIVPPTLPKDDSLVFSPLPQGTAYRYDQLNRLVEMKAWQNLNTTTNTWGSGLTYNGMYNNKFTYDANGSMLTAFANNQAGQTIDNQIYHHQTVNGRKFSNRTYAITDSASITSGDDLLNQIAYTNNPDSVNVYNNYSYTEIGERKSNKQDSIALITWTVYGKIDSVARITGSSKYNLKFNYDAAGKRVSKKVYTSDNTWLYSEYYVRDAQGNLMSTYTHQVTDSTATVSFAQTEKEIYGSNELGIDITKTELIGTLPVSTIFTRTLDNKHYTGSNHLGNILTTFTDRKLPIDADNNGIIDAFFPDVIASNDFMPFGAYQTERTYKKYTFPNSFNGKRDDNELKCQDFGGREYDKFGREPITIDKLFNKAPFLSPYSFAGNMPISAIDYNGDYIYVVVNGKLHDINSKEAENFKQTSGYNTLMKTPSGKALLDKYATSEKTDIYIAFGETKPGSNASTTNPIKKPKTVEGEITSNGAFKGLTTKPTGEEVFLVTLNTNEFQKNETYQDASVLFHEVKAHVDLNDQVEQKVNEASKTSTKTKQELTDEISHGAEGYGSKYSGYEGNDVVVGSPAAKIKAELEELKAKETTKVKIVPQKGVQNKTPTAIPKKKQN